MSCSHVKIGKLLVSRGADVNAKDIEGNTPLIWFLRGLVRQGEARGYLKWLLSVGANPDDVSSTGETAREMALKKYGLNLDDLK